MIVRYVGDYYKVSLKKNKVYTVEDDGEGVYCISDETGEEYCFGKDDFEIVEE